MCPHGTELNKKKAQRKGALHLSIKQAMGGKDTACRYYHGYRGDNRTEIIMNCMSPSLNISSFFLQVIQK
jgi:hypothetical protein